ncbi:hypothetical protein LX59_03063 [Azomonas agilis]|uniref:Uncharacterized protein n=1 Tax=Azomonas agilis TaxID=116849 RepID=A0A562HYR6_9GAMM|nr:hypothetical protein [Azomonas agilis]TWH63812.1 hypothetical protein LX59_03063 [Azomonas agilis]
MNSQQSARATGDEQRARIRAETGAWNSQQSARAAEDAERIRTHSTSQEAQYKAAEDAANRARTEDAARAKAVDRRNKLFSSAKYGVGAAAAMAGLDAIRDIYNTATKEDSTWRDVASESVHSANRVAGAGLGASIGTQWGGRLGARGGVLGGLAGAAIGAAAPDWITKNARGLMGLSSAKPQANVRPDLPTISPAVQPQQENAPMLVLEPQAPSVTAGQAAQTNSSGLRFPYSDGDASFIPPISSSTGGLNFPQRAAPNGWTHTGIGSGNSQIVGRVGKDGVPAFTNDAAAVSGAAAMPDNGIGKVGGLNSGQRFTQMQPGDSARARDEWDRAIGIRNQTIRNLAASEPNGLTIVPDSAEPARQARTQQIQASSGLNSRAARAQAGLAIQAQTNQLRAAELAQQGDISRQGLGLRSEELAGQRQDSAADRGLKRDQLSGIRQDSAADRTLRERELGVTEASSRLSNQRTQQEIDEGGIKLSQQRRLQELRDTIADPSKTDAERFAAQRSLDALSIKAEDRFKASQDREQARNKLLADLFGTYSDQMSLLDPKDKVPFDQWMKPLMQATSSAQSGLTLVGYSEGKPVFQDASGKRFRDE